MAEPSSDESITQPFTEYNIVGQAGYITANFRSPYNSMHQISGFKTERDARAWIAEARLLIGRYAWLV